MGIRKHPNSIRILKMQRKYFRPGSRAYNRKTAAISRIRKKRRR